MIRVLIVDDKPLVRKGIRALLGRSPDIECIGKARDGREAIEPAARLQPDMITMDINMPNVNGLDATSRICSLGGPIRI